MELKQLRQIIAVAQSGSVSAAAKSLGLAQPALSLALSRAEAALGVRLFHRSRRGAEPTKAGKQLVEEALQIVTRADAFEQQAKGLATGTAGELTVGFISSALYTLIPRALANLKRQHPDVQVLLRELNSTEQVAALQESRIDVGFSRAPITAPRQIARHIVLSDPLIAAVPASFAVKSDGSVDLSAIADFGLILSPETQGAMRARILYAVSKVNPSPRIVQEANVGLTMLSCVSAGLGVALLPRSVRVITFEGVRFCRITPDVLPPLEISVIWRPSSRPRLTDLFVQMIGAQTSAAVRRRGR